MTMWAPSSLWADSPDRANTTRDLGEDYLPRGRQGISTRTATVSALRVRKSLATDHLELSKTEPNNQKQAYATNDEGGRLDRIGAGLEEVCWHGDYHYRSS